MGILSGNPKEEPMHYGEVFGLWSSLMVAQSSVAAHQTMLNHAGDHDLIKLLKEAIELAQQEIKQIEPLLKENGVALPAAPPNRPDARIEDIPAGARFQDPEIATALSTENAAGLVACSSMIGKSIREDIATMYSQFHAQKMALGSKLLRLNKEKGWLMPPPLHYYKTEDC